MENSELDRIQNQLEKRGYVTDASIVMSVFLSTTLHKPLLLEGPAGVGKTEVAKVMAAAMDTDLIRLQCYEGLDVNTALYEWNYQHQLLHIKLGEQSGKSVAQKETEIFGEAFLLKRPLLAAITHCRPPVLLIDELDRADEEFESFLLEILSDWQVSIPEIGTISATHIPSVVVTSNRTRELSDAVRRRCLYLWIEYPSLEKELAIVRSKVPGIDERLGTQICQFMRRLRELKLGKSPGVAETLDWAMALVALHRTALDLETIEETLGLVCKNRDDIAAIRLKFLPELVDAVTAEAG